MSASAWKRWQEVAADGSLYPLYGVRRGFGVRNELVPAGITRLRWAVHRSPGHCGSFSGVENS
jgi:hypothetical protein